MYQLALVVCDSFGPGNEGGDISTCPAGDLIIRYVQVPELVDYEAAFVQFDPDVSAVIFGACLTLFAVGWGVGAVLRVLRMRSRI